MWNHRPVPNWSPLLSPGREEVRARFTSPMTQFLLSAPEQARAMGGRDRAEPKGRSPSFLRNRFRIRERGEDRGRPTDKTIEKNLDNGHLRNSSRGREGACAVERGINQEEELVASIQPTIGHTSHSNEPPLSLSPSFH